MPDGKQLSDGVFFTTDPAQARSFATVLLVGESQTECEVVGLAIGQDAVGQSGPRHR